MLSSKKHKMITLTHSDDDPLKFGKIESENIIFNFKVSKYLEVVQ